MPQSLAMNDATLSLDTARDALIERGLARLRSASADADILLADARYADRVSRVIAASDFALETLRRQPDLLVALLHAVQATEEAGQERAMGALLYASGHCQEAHQQRLLHLIDAQERSLRVFGDFAEPALRARWDELQLAPCMATLERLRRGALYACSRVNRSAKEMPMAESAGAERVISISYLALTPSRPLERPTPTSQEPLL